MRVFIVLCDWFLTIDNSVWLYKYDQLIIVNYLQLLQYQLLIFNSEIFTKNNNILSWSMQGVWSISQARNTDINWYKTYKCLADIRKVMLVDNLLEI